MNFVQVHLNGGKFLVMNNKTYFFSFSCSLCEQVIPNYTDQDSKKSCALYSHLPNGQGIRQFVCQLNHEKSKLRLGRASKILELLYLFQGQGGIKFSSSPVDIYERDLDKI